MDIKALAEQADSYIIERRRFYHTCPELSHEEKNTRASIKKDLEALGITDIHEADNCYGLYADIHGARPGRTVALRADIDGLPVKEETGLPFTSQNEGKMHACGHDNHIAMLLGAAKILAEHKDELCGTVRLVVQPSEESMEGAPWMIEAGVLEGVDAIYGAHIWGNFDAPLISIEPGPRMAYAGVFSIEVEGLAAHGSAPHLGFDAITAAAAIISNIQQYVSRQNDPLDPLVCTIGTIKGGSRFNVIANHVTMEGTLRAYHADGHKAALTRIIEKTGEALGVKARLIYNDFAAPVINDDDELTELARNAVKKLYGESSLGHLEKMLGSEDFASYAEKIPAVFGFIGSRNAEKGYIYTNHHEKYTVDEDVLHRGAAVMAQFAYDYLEKTK